MANVTQPLAKPDRAPRGGDSSSRLTLVSDAMPASADDSGQGLGLFVLFTVAVLVVTVAVGFLALLTSWWVLGVVFGLHVLVTAIVGTAVFSVLRSGEPGLDSDNLVQFGDAANPEGPVHSRGQSSQASAVAA
jgi:hypothetical protein